MSHTEASTSGAVARALMALIRVYQLLISPLLGPVCRFHPSCSRYTSECLRLHGAARGSYLGLRRILRCHPFNPGGYDPPPLPKREPRAPDELEPAAASPTKAFEADRERC